MDVREATSDELSGVMNVLDGAALAVDVETARAGIEADGTLVAVTDDDRILGALVLDGEHIAAVAVRRRRRGQGIGSALVRAAVARRERLVAEFDAGLREFYAGLGFDLEGLDEPGRVRGVR
ncbi:MULTISPECIES: GNAT family N-acetyltransferase [Haloarcula]|uniref:GNAT family N-acetyltransferase n=1 Tax=Haloarcula TaxID=2237 RepID=UPI0023EAA988|nr:GNAT family N-acetyltransferase [Halomicroarcula sp. XH51]